MLIERSHKKVYQQDKEYRREYYSTILSALFYKSLMFYYYFTINDTVFLLYSPDDALID